MNPPSPSLPSKGMSSIFSRVLSSAYFSSVPDPVRVENACVPSTSVRGPNQHPPPPNPPGPSPLCSSASHTRRLVGAGTPLHRPGHRPSALRSSNHSSTPGPTPTRGASLFPTVPLDTPPATLPTPSAPSNPSTVAAAVSERREREALEAAKIAADEAQAQAQAQAQATESSTSPRSWWGVLGSVARVGGWSGGPHHHPDPATTPLEVAGEEGELEEITTSTTTNPAGSITPSAPVLSAPSPVPATTPGPSHTNDLALAVTHAALLTKYAIKIQRAYRNRRALDAWEAADPTRPLTRSQKKRRSARRRALQRRESRRLEEEARAAERQRRIELGLPLDDLHEDVKEDENPQGSNQAVPSESGSGPASTTLPDLDLNESVIMGGGARDATSTSTSHASHAYVTELMQLETTNATATAAAVEEGEKEEEPTSRSVMSSPDRGLPETAALAAELGLATAVDRESDLTLDKTASEAEVAELGRYPDPDADPVVPPPPTPPSKIQPYHHKTPPSPLAVSAPVVSTVSMENLMSPQRRGRPTTPARDRVPSGALPEPTVDLSPAKQLAQAHVRSTTTTSAYGHGPSASWSRSSVGYPPLSVTSSARLREDILLELAPQMGLAIRLLLEKLEVSFEQQVRVLVEKNGGFVSDSSSRSPLRSSTTTGAATTASSRRIHGLHSAFAELAPALGEAAVDALHGAADAAARSMHDRLVGHHRVAVRGGHVTSTSSPAASPRPTSNSTTSPSATTTTTTAGAAAAGGGGGGGRPSSHAVVLQHLREEQITVAEKARCRAEEERDDARQAKAEADEMDQSMLRRLARVLPGCSPAHVRWPEGWDDVEAAARATVDRLAHAEQKLSTVGRVMGSVTELQKSLLQAADAVDEAETNERRAQQQVTELEASLEAAQKENQARSGRELLLATALKEAQEHVAMAHAKTEAAERRAAEADAVADQAIRAALQAHVSQAGPWKEQGPLHHGPSVDNTGTPLEPPSSTSLQADVAAAAAALSMPSPSPRKGGSNGGDGGGGGGGGGFSRPQPAAWVGEILGDQFRSSAKGGDEDRVSRPYATATVTPATTPARVNPTPTPTPTPTPAPATAGGGFLTPRGSMGQPARRVSNHGSVSGAGRRSVPSTPRATPRSGSAMISTWGEDPDFVAARTEGEEAEKEQLARLPGVLRAMDSGISGRENQVRRLEEEMGKVSDKLREHGVALPIRREPGAGTKWSFGALGRIGTVQSRNGRLIVVSGSTQAPVWTFLAGLKRGPTLHPSPSKQSQLARDRVNRTAFTVI